MAVDVRRDLTGIHAATIVPFRADFSLDEDELAAHLEAVAETPGIRGLLVNGHAGENFVLSRSEKRRVVEVARAIVPPSCVIVSGVNAEGSLDAAVEAAELEAAGADALLVFPANSWALDHDSRVVITHHEYIIRATSVPLLLYGAPVGAGCMAYSPALLAQLAAEPRILGIKEGSWEVAHYEANRRLLKEARPDFLVLGSGDEHLLASYMVGSDGSQVSLAAVVPDILVRLWDAAEARDWDAARRLHDAIYPLAVAVYRDAPGARATARLKACLRLLGRLPSDAVRPPQPPVSSVEEARLAEALDRTFALAAAA